MFPEKEQILFALRVETEELGITAGLQDRVIQVKEGAVMMHFTRELVEKSGNGEYSSIDVSLLPPLFLAYAEHPQDISFYLFD